MGFRQVRIGDKNNRLIQTQELVHQTGNCVQIYHDLPQGKYMRRYVYENLKGFRKRSLAST